LKTSQLSSPFIDPLAIPGQSDREFTGADNP